MRRAIPALISIGLVVSPPSLGAQVVSRKLPAPDAKLAAEFSSILSVRELQDGRLLVADAGEQRISLVDFSRNTSTAVGRQGKGPAEYGAVSRLYALAGDSTLMPDNGNGRWAIFMGDRIVRTVPPTDPAAMAARGPFRGADANGRVLSAAPSGAAVKPKLGKGDSSLVLLVTLSSSHVDTITRVQVGPRTIQVKYDKAGQPTSVSVMGLPLGVGEETLLLPDGWVAVARLDPYRVDWRRPDGRWTRGAPLPFVVLPVNAREKEAFLNRRAEASGKAPVPPAEDAWPATIPPFQPFPMVPAPNGDLLLQRTPSADHPGNRYDRIDRNGRLVGWLELPPNERIVGVGRRGAYVVVTDDDGLQHLQRHPWS